MKEIQLRLKLLWKKFQCFCKDHDLGAYVNWTPEVVCMRIVCGRCGRHVAHIDLPANPTKQAKKEILH